MPLTLTPTTPGTLFLVPPCLTTGGGVYNVKDYGAIGNGVANDGAAISAAIAACSAGGGGWVFVPIGTYLYSAAFTVPANVYLGGAGEGSVLKATNSASSAVTVSGTGSGVANLKLTCPSAAGASSSGSAAGFYVTASRFALANVLVDTVANGAFVFDGAQDGTVVNCTALNSWRDAFHVRGQARRIQIEGCYASNNGDDSFGVVSYGTDAGQCEYITYLDCNSDTPRTGGGGFKVAGGRHIRIIGGSSYRASVYGAQLSPDGSVPTYGNYDVAMIGTSIVSSDQGAGAYAGIRIAGYDGTHLAEKTRILSVNIYDAALGAANGFIDVGSYAQDVLIEGCQMELSGDFGIDIGVSSSGAGVAPVDVRVINNTLKATATYGVYADYVGGALEVSRNTFRDINTSNSAGTPSVIHITANCAAAVIRVEENQHLGSAVGNLTFLLRQLNAVAIRARDNFSESGKSLSCTPANGELTYTEITGTVNITATTSATANTIITAPAYVFDGNTPVLIEADFSSFDKGTTFIVFVLYDGSTQLGQWGFANGIRSTGDHAHLQRRLTPSAASHTYSIRAYVDAGTGHVYAGTGASGAELPSFLRLTAPSPPY